MDTTKWFLLTYKVPAEPNRHRVALWRKLKGLGAVYLQNGACLLPMTSNHRRALKLIEREIADIGGEAILLQSAALDRDQSEKVIARFRADRDEAYKELLDRCDDFEAEIAKEIAADHYNYAEIEENDEDLKKLKAWFEKIRKLDFYGASLAQQAKARLDECESLLEDYANQVFARQEENRPPNAEEG